MTRVWGKAAWRKAFGAALVLGCAAVTLPAFGAAPASVSAAPAGLPSFAAFTPARIDRGLAEAIAARMGPGALRFTPAGSTARRERAVTVAVRVDREVARSIAVRRALAGSKAEVGLRASAPVLVAPTRYDLGMARGYQSFAQGAPAALRLPEGVRNVPMQDLSRYSPARATPGKPTRFQPRIALDTDREEVGRTPKSIEALGQQSVDLSGSYRVLRNLDVTAGVRLSQDRDRLAPLTDTAQDSQAVYVGTQFRF